jgi:TRAP-type C4-dicarboxylate transport system substrate-binding protein
MTLNRRTAALLAASTLSLPLSLHAQALPLRIASVVPRHSPYHQQLLELGEAGAPRKGRCALHRVHRRQPGRRGRDVRRMRIGQLQGALLSVVGLREIEPGIGRAAEACRCCSAAGRSWTMCARRCARRWSSASLARASS